MKLLMHSNRLSPSHHLITSSAFNELQRLLARALYVSGRSFAVDEYSFGLPTILGKGLIDAGFVKVQVEAHVIDFSL